MPVTDQPLPQPLCDPYDPTLVYVRGVLPDWMKEKMTEQGYDPGNQADREAFKRNYLVAADPAAVSTLPESTPTPGTALAPATLDGEWISREARLATLEAEADSARATYVQAHCRYGDILMEYRDLCALEGERFSAFLDRQGLSRRRAYELIRVAEGVRQFPALRDLAAGQYSKALALIESMPGEDLSRLMDGQMDLTRDEIDRLPIRALKDRVRSLTQDQARLVEQETKLLRSEKDALAADLKAARAALDGDLAAARKTVRTLRESTMALAAIADTLLDQFGALAPRDVERLKPELESCLSGASLHLKVLWEQVQERLLAIGVDD